MFGSGFHCLPAGGAPPLEIGGTSRYIDNMPESTPLLFQAIEFAAKAHSGQYRKSTRLPYILHPLNVAKILIDCGCREALVIAGLLHDVVEDTPATLQDVRAAFGEKVAHLVAANSEPNKCDPWEKRKRDFIESLNTAPEDALIVACADKLDNIRAIREDLARLGEAVWPRFTRPREQQRWYFTALVKAFQARAAREPLATLATQLAEEVHAVFGADEP